MFFFYWSIVELQCFDVVLITSVQQRDSVIGISNLIQTFWE